MHTENRFALSLTLIATLLALCVVMLGAYTRLKDAGLGCPDWPGCYGQVIAPDNAKSISKAEDKFPGATINETKAWTEMTHRYAVGLLGIFIVSISFLTLRKRHLPQQPFFLPLILISVAIFQGLLGKWTVTMKLLPVVVMSHLLGGMTILSLLWLMTLRLSNAFYRVPTKDMIDNNTSKYKFWAALALIVVIAQIFLGGWTSSNYAALICPTFPYCQGQLWPAMNFHTAFQFWMPTGINYQGGVLGNTARVTIQMMHRIGALITALYVGGLAFWLLIASNTKAIKKIAATILFILFLQITLGILNVVLLLPISTAVAHNGVAALLLLSVVTLNYAVYVSAKSVTTLSMPFSRERFA